MWAYMWTGNALVKCLKWSVALLVVGLAFAGLGQLELAGMFLQLIMIPVAIAGMRVMMIPFWPLAKPKKKKKK